MYELDYTIFNMSAQAEEKNWQCEKGATVPHRKPLYIKLYIYHDKKEKGITAQATPFQ